MTRYPSDAAILLAVAELCGPEGAAVTVAQLAAHAEVSSRTVLRALPRLEADGAIEREGGERRINVIRLVGDAPDPVELCHQADEPGEEYMAVDPTAARAVWRQRMIDCYRLARGLPHWREAGRYLAEGGDLPALSERAKNAAEMAGGEG